MCYWNYKKREENEVEVMFGDIDRIFKISKRY